MYYISSNKQDLEDYNNLVSQSESYDGVSTISWANIIEHKDGGQYAILANSKYPAELTGIDNLEGWFNPEI